MLAFLPLVVAVSWRLGDLEYVTKGMYGRIYRTLFQTDADGGVEVAVKIVPRDLYESITPFEMDAMRRAGNCPGVLRLISGFQKDGQVWLISRWLQNENLEEVIEGGRSLEVGEVEVLARRLLSSLACLHSNGVAHNDLNSSNVILADGVEQPVIIDFGLADLDQKSHHYKADVLALKDMVAQLVSQGSSEFISSLLARISEKCDEKDCRADEIINDL